jgi:protein-tyrosine-phosphatase/DNA-binding HxlR family transcriptional regulator
MSDALNRRAAVFAALGEPARLLVVDKLLAGDLSPGELMAELGIAGNLLAHHLRVLEQAGIIRRTRSEGDRRRTYIQLRRDNPDLRVITDADSPGCLPAIPARVLFVCTANSARSQLAAASWNNLSPIPAVSAGTHPAERVHPRAVEVARRHGLQLENAVPADLGDVLSGDELVVAVCDRSHEELGRTLPRLHWSVPDPARRDDDGAFEDAYTELSQRVGSLFALQADPRKAP